MLLRKKGINYFLIENLKLDESGEDEFIKMNPEYEKVTNLPFSTSGVYRKINNVFIVSEEHEMKSLLDLKLSQVEDIFDTMMFSGVFTSSLGFPVDNRRSEGKNDKDNVQSLIDLQLSPVYFKDSNNEFHELTIQDLETIKMEMVQDGLAKYQWKWAKQQELAAAQSLQELENIVITR